MNTTGRSPVCWCEHYRAWCVVVWSEIEYSPFMTTNRDVAEFFAANGYIRNW